MANVAYLLSVRETARRHGDRGLYAAMTADLARVGYIDPPAAPHPDDVEPLSAGVFIPEGRDKRKPERVETATGMETAAVRAPERVIPQVAAKPKPREQRNRGGRPPLPRCEHNKIVGRCNKCPKP